MFDWFVRALHLSDPNTWLVIVAGVFELGGFAARRMMLLRALLGSSALLSLVANVGTGQPVSAIGNAGIIGINLYQMVRLYFDEKPLALPADLAAIYSQHFTCMTTREFSQWLTLGARITSSGVHLCRQGERATRMYLLLRGTAEVRLDGLTVAILSPGEFIGEMSFLSGRAYSADVIAPGEIDYVTWSQAQVADLHVSRASLYVKVLAAMGNNLVFKLLEVDRLGSSRDDQAQASAVESAPGNPGNTWTL